ncbi:MAG: hypothetical protein GY926_12420 [bacterium]|nr:hypothetical protein [bacterium]
MTYTIHATKKLLDRVKRPAEAPVDEPSTVLGSWYATAVFWKPQVAIPVVRCGRVTVSLIVKSRRSWFRCLAVEL